MMSALMLANRFEGLEFMKRLGGILFLLVLLIPTAMAATIGISPGAIEPGDTVTVSVNDLPDNTPFSLGIRGEFATVPGDTFTFAIRDLSFPFSLNQGEMNAYTQGTTWTKLSAELPDGGSFSMNHTAKNGEVRSTQPRNIGNGTLSLIALDGKVAAGSIITDLTLMGMKQGPDDGAISFAIEGFEQGTVTVTVYIDGVEALSRVILVGEAPIPTPAPTPIRTPTPTSTPIIPGTLEIVSNKNTVVRGNSFVVTITGESSKEYHLFIDEVEGPGPGGHPVVAPGQVGVVSPYNPTNVTIRTNAGGTRSIQFNTNQSTDTRTFTVGVADPADPEIYDEVKVRVEEGAVTITASGTGVYYLGEEITLSGTNTASDTTYLFLTGPNLGTNGVNLTRLAPVKSNDSGSFTRVAVNADDTWSYKWSTADLAWALDAGTYTIYAVSQPRSKDSLTGVRFATTSIGLRAPTLSARTSGATLTPGDDYRIGGIATGAPEAVQIWIFGKNYYKLGMPVAVESDGSFEYVLTGAETADLAKGQYYVVVQHPAGNEFGVKADPATGMIYGYGINNVTLTSLQAPAAASALINALNSPNIDDIYIKLSFTVDGSWIRIDGLSDQTYGETFRITGTTSYSPGTVLGYWIAAQDSGAVSLSGETVISDNGEWSIDLDTTAIGPGAYAFHISAPDGQESATVLFDIYDDITHPLPPGGGSYRVERVGVTPSLDSLSPGEEVALNGIIRLDGAIGHPYSPSGPECLEFATDVKAPRWSYNLKVDGNLIYTEPVAITSRSFTLSSWELGYRGDVRIILHLSGTVPETAGTQDPVLLRILQRGADGRIIPGSEHRLAFTPAGNDPVQPFGDNLTLSPGWNFISIPRPLAAGNDTAMIFAGINTTGRSVLRYNTTIRDWTQLDKEDRIAPLEGLWIYSTGPATVPLNFSTDPLLPPAERTLSAGWNAIGTTGTAPATAKDTLYSVNREWSTLIGFNAGSQSFEAGIVNGGSDANADTRPVYPGRGYWLSMSGPGTLYAIGA